ncbi:MAG TPA: hypothetical protein VGG75_28645 [Trebonia sp.]
MIVFPGRVLPDLALPAVAVFSVSAAAPPARAAVPPKATASAGTPFKAPAAAG